MNEELLNIIPPEFQAEVVDKSLMPIYERVPKYPWMTSVIDELGTTHCIKLKVPSKTGSSGAAGITNSFREATRKRGYRAQCRLVELGDGTYTLWLTQEPKIKEEEKTQW